MKKKINHYVNFVRIIHRKYIINLKSSKITAHVYFFDSIKWKVPLSLMRTR